MTLDEDDLLGDDDEEEEEEEKEEAPASPLSLAVSSPPSLSLPPPLLGCSCSRPLTHSCVHVVWSTDGVTSRATWR